MFDLQAIVLLARAPTTSIAEAEDLIRQYAVVVAGDAVAKALEEAHARTVAVLSMPLTQGAPHAQA